MMNDAPPALEPTAIPPLNWPPPLSSPPQQSQPLDEQQNDLARFWLKHAARRPRRCQISMFQPPLWEPKRGAASVISYHVHGLPYAESVVGDAMRLATSDEQTSHRHGGLFLTDLNQHQRRDEMS
ncbi:hypothetical protein ACHAQJ_004167 [Trichoderma viride]